jgi:hypothetical protein
VFEGCPFGFLDESVRVTIRLMTNRESQGRDTENGDQTYKKKEKKSNTKRRKRSQFWNLQRNGKAVDKSYACPTSSNPQEPEQNATERGEEV